MKKIISIIICTLLIVAVTVTALAEAEDDLLTVGDETLVGDINGDGELNNKDVVLLFRYVSSGEKSDDETIYDYNGDGNVDNKDVVSLFRAVSGSSATEEPEESEPEPEPSEPEPESSEPEPESSEPEPESSEPEPESSEPEPESSEPEPESSEPEPESSDEEPVEPPFVPDESYLVYEELVCMKRPEDYTFKEFSGLYSGLKNGTADGTCFFNYQVANALPPTTEGDVTGILDQTQAQFNNAFGDYTFKSFESYEVDGCTVTKLDWKWENDMDQSKVMIHFDDCTVVIQFAAWAAYPEAAGEFDDMISTLRIYPGAV